MEKNKMHKIILDGQYLLEKETSHVYLQEKLNLPEYYGKNLDALYDCLCEMEEEIELINPEDVDKDIIDTFKNILFGNVVLIRIFL
jgi:RNAse (barnase) inhibitor barstar